jgi:hypothetical protein
MKAIALLLLLTGTICQAQDQWIKFFDGDNDEVRYFDQRKIVKVKGVVLVWEKVISKNNPWISDEGKTYRSLLRRLSIDCKRETYSVTSIEWYQNSDFSGSMDRYSNQDKRVTDIPISGSMPALAKRVC